MGMMNSRQHEAVSGGGDRERERKLQIHHEHVTSSQLPWERRENLSFWRGPLREHMHPWISSMVFLLHYEFLSDLPSSLVFIVLANFSVPSCSSHLSSYSTCHLLFLRVTTSHFKLIYVLKNFDRFSNYISFTYEINAWNAMLIFSYHFSHSYSCNWMGVFKSSSSPMCHGSFKNPNITWMARTISPKWPVHDVKLKVWNHSKHSHRVF